MRPLDSLFPTEDYPSLLVWLSAPDDAAVYRLDSERAFIATVDFFPPVVDDPFSFGAIAAANALSDIYAMGGEPLLAINLAAFPDALDMAILTEILRGGAEKVREAGAVIAGGHTVTDKEPKYGLAVNGLIHPDKIITKSGAKPGDKLILTKALGTGVVTTALKNNKAAADHVTAAVASMSRLNRDASRLAQRTGVHAMTDITGYSLVGHAHEMAHLSGVDFLINYDALRWLPGAVEYAEQGICPGGTFRNMEYFEPWLQGADLTEPQRCLLFDPQTSGGLLMAISAEKVQALCDELITGGDVASIVGEVQPGSGNIRIL